MSAFVVQLETNGGPVTESQLVSFEVKDGVLRSSVIEFKVMRAGQVTGMRVQSPSKDRELLIEFPSSMNVAAGDSFCVRDVAWPPHTKDLTW